MTPLLILAVTSGTTLGGLLIYFLFGAAGTFGRVWLSPSLEMGMNKRTVVETFMGGVSGMLLPFIGTGISSLVGVDVEAMFAGTSPIVRTVLVGALVCFLSYSGSLTVGEILGRLKGGSGSNSPIKPGS